MTNPNPPDDQSTGAQWWETPAVSAGPVGGNAGATPNPDPTMLNQNQSPQQPSDPTLLRKGPDPQPYASGPQYPNAPQYPNQGQFPGQQQPQPWQANTPPPAPPNFGPPPVQPPGYGPPPPSGGGNKTPWVLGGAALLIVVVAIGVGVVAISNVAGGDDETGSGQTESWEGDYSMEGVGNACDLVTPTVLRQWAPVQKETKHTESPARGDYGGGSLNCRIDNEGPDSDDAGLIMDASFDSKYGTPSYQTWKDSDTSTSGTGYSQGPVNGLGEEAYFASKHRPYSSFTSFDYTIGVRDSNISVKIQLNLSLRKSIDKQAVDQAAVAQARQVLSGLRK